MKKLPFLFAAVALAQTAPAPYQVNRAARPIQIDGRANEAAWKPAAKLELGSASSTARLLWDDDFLYVALDCRGSPMEDSVTIRINPKPVQTDGYIGLEIERRAIARPFLSAGGYVFRQFHLQGVRLSTYLEEDGWTAEVAIPWSNFDDLSRQHGAGNTWTANLGRGAAPQPGPERFGELVFVK
jgi:hypothetical protein